MVAGSVNINEATELQLRGLLDIDEQTAARITASRPFAEGKPLRDILPKGARKKVHGLDLRKLDINEANADALQRLAGVSREAAEAILARRPVHILLELADVEGLDAAAFGRLVSLFRSSEVAYTDKQSGQTVELVPASDELLVKIDQAEAALSPGLRKRLSRGSAESEAAGRYAVYKVPQVESPAAALAELKQAVGLQLTLPSFRDGQGARRHLDPAYCVIQFKRSVRVAEQAKILAGVGLAVEEKHRTPGLVTARLAEGAGIVRLGEVIAALNGLDTVEFAEPAYMGFDDLESGGAAGTDALPWHLEVLEAAPAWERTTGRPEVVIAIIDTGVDEAPSLAAGLAPRADGEHWNFEDDADPAPKDANGHGTFIAGLLGADGTAEVRGLCPACRILPLRVPLTGSPSAYARRRDAILYALQYVKPADRLILNLSWKTAGDVALIRDALETAAATGAIVVASAGNWPERENEPHYPSDYSSVIAVGAVGADGSRAPYSFFGREVDLAAPGGAGGTDAEANLRSLAIGGGTRVDFGTSFAAPLAAGVAALIWSRNLKLSATEVRTVLQDTAGPLSGAGLGSGLVNALSAVGAVGAEPVPGTEPQAARPQDMLEFLNSAPVDRLVSQLDLLRITARLIAQRRPWQAIADIWPTLGLTRPQFEALVA